MEAHFFISSLNQEFKYKKSIENIPQVGDIEDICIAYLLSVVTCPEQFLQFSKSGLGYGPYKVVKVDASNSSPLILLQRQVG